MKKSNDFEGKASKLKYFLQECFSKSAFFLMLYDVLAMGCAYFFALWLSYECRISLIPKEMLRAWLVFLPIYSFAGLALFFLSRLYQRIWKFASFVELERVLVASAILALFHTVGITLLLERMPTAYYVMGATFQTILVLLPRFGYRFVLLERNRRAGVQNRNLANRVMLIGAGSAGQMVLRDLNGARQMHDYVCCIIDDDDSKWGCSIDGVPVVGGRDDILLNVKKFRIEKIYLAMPNATAEQRRDILTICRMTACELKNLPSIRQIVDGRVNADNLKEVAPEDLLGRAQIQVDMEGIYRFLTGKTILVTGGGGSIGSELCRQIASHHPKKLIVFDIYENNAHAIGLELRDKYPNLDLEVLIGSVRDSRRINQVFEKYRPEVVYHAAAHKHVPLMEDSPCEAIKNNAIGTYKTAYAAMMNGCKRFVLISTDKAVNPTNIMGASKRLCEMIIQSFAQKVKEGRAEEILPLYVHSNDEDGSMRCMRRNAGQLKTQFVAVRFGNVLGSNGSVIPRFKEQIARGGPVTVTHPDIIRYFMTIPEAASLVLQAGTYAKGGEIFVLDMGAPVKIDTMARNLIRLSGLQPDVDIKIEYTGLRPGEKLYEEKLMGEEGMKTTPNRLIHIGRPIAFDCDAFLHQLQNLMTAAYDGQEDIIRNVVENIVPTYRPAGVHGSEEKGEAFQKQMEQVETNEAVPV